MEALLAVIATNLVLAPLIYHLLRRIDKLEDQVKQLESRLKDKLLAVEKQLDETTSALDDHLADDPNYMIKGGKDVPD